MAVERWLIVLVLVMSIEACASGWVSGLILGSICVERVLLIGLYVYFLFTS